MKILIANDDSIHAPGIALLAKVAMEFGEVTVVAPAQQCSAMSQRLTIHGPIKVEKVEDFPVPVTAAYKVAGTPADCVKVALHYILEEKPDYVFSGINDGYNVGYDISYSGTLGAAFEAVKNGIPAMAFSAAKNDWLSLAESRLAPIIRELLDAGQEPGTVWNVNFPARIPEDVVEILRDRTIAPVSMYQEYYIPQEQEDGSVDLDIGIHLVPNDQLPEGSDAYAVRSGFISIGKVRDRVT
jgi:5'-nucleotidase